MQKIGIVADDLRQYNDYLYDVLGVAPSSLVAASNYIYLNVEGLDQSKLRGLDLSDFMFASKRLGFTYQCFKTIERRVRQESIPVEPEVHPEIMRCLRETVLGESDDDILIVTNDAWAHFPVAPTWVMDAIERIILKFKTLSENPLPEVDAPTRHALYDQLDAKDKEIAELKGKLNLCEITLNGIASLASPLPGYCQRLANLCLKRVEGENNG